MCGYCFEGGNLSYNTMQLEVLPSELQMLMPTNLEDCLDIHSALDSIAPQKEKLESVAMVICCRGLEVLIAEGFSSENYQALLSNSKFIAAVDVFTGEENRKRYLAEDPRFDLAIARWVLDKAVFTQVGYLENKMSRWTRGEVESLLKQYADFYLDGIGLKRNDLNKIMEETGVMDPIDDICIEDRQVFTDRFPAFWCALHWLGGQTEDVPLLWEMTTKNAIGVPDFEGLELWLQRRAALISYDLNGLERFGGNLTSIRPELFWYLALMRPLSDQERAVLLEALNQLTVDDLQGDFSVRLWLETGDLQLAS